MVTSLARDKGCSGSRVFYGTHWPLRHFYLNIRRVSIAAKIVYYFPHGRPPVYSSACISRNPTGQISLKFDTGNFHESLARKSKSG